LKTNTILVTGASGKTGISVIQSLLDKGYSVRAYVHRSSQANLFDNRVQLFIGDLSSTHDLAHAMDDVTAVYHICPNMHPGEVSIGRRVIQVAKSAAIEHFVFHSVLHPQIKEMPHHWNKMRVEGLLFKSGLNYTILQPAAYMQNILQYKKAILEQKVYAVPYNGETRIGMVNLDDVAEAAATVICQSCYYGGIYELATHEAPSQVELAQLISQVVHKEIRFEELSRNQWIKDIRKTGMTDFAITTLVKMFEYYETYGFYGNGTTLSAIINRKPKTLIHFIRNNFT
ncbi:MAG: NmrA family NAD(P)-binding protein, partial [Anaerolineaceae bacterium]